METEIIAINHNIKELKDKIREVIKEFTGKNSGIDVSVVYYEINDVRKPLKRIKKNGK